MPDETPRITDDLRMAMARVWDEWADMHGVAAPAHIVDAWLSVTIAADALDADVAALTAQRDAARAAVDRIESLCEHSEAFIGGYVHVDYLRSAVAAGASPVAADPAQSIVEIGGQVMTQAQFDAARFPLLNSPSGPTSPPDAMSVTLDRPDARSLREG